MPVFEWWFIGTLSASSFIAGFQTQRLIAKMIPTQLLTNNHVPWEMIKAKQTIRCRFVKVSDSDNIRVVHVPKFWWLRGLGVNPGNWVTGPKPDADNSSSSNPPFKAWDWTLNIRLMGIDAPESAAFGMPQQKFNQEAKDWISSNLQQNQPIHVKLLRRDQYNRLVCSVEYNPKLYGISHRITRIFGIKRNLSLQMVRAGWAAVYKQANAEYDGLEELLLKEEKKAKRKKIGIWKDPKIVLPSEHKKAHLRT